MRHRPFDPPVTPPPSTASAAKKIDPPVISIWTTTCGNCSTKLTNRSGRPHRVWGHICLNGMGCRVGKEST
jgi:hypothetical protein